MFPHIESPALNDPRQLCGRKKAGPFLLPPQETQIDMVSLKYLRKQELVLLPHSTVRHMTST